MRSPPELDYLQTFFAATFCFSFHPVISGQSLRVLSLFYYMLDASERHMWRFGEPIEASIG